MMVVAVLLLLLPVRLLQRLCAWAANLSGQPEQRGTCLLRCR